MKIEYLPKHIQESLNRIHNKQQDFKTAILEISSEHLPNTMTSTIREIILSKDDSNEAKRNNIAITEASTEFIKSLHSYLHRLGVNKENLIIAQTVINTQLTGESGLNNNKVTVIPKQTDDISLKMWFDIIDEQSKHTENIGYDFNNIKTEQLETDLCRACCNTVSSICSFVFALGVDLKYDEFDNEKEYEDEDFVPF